MTWAQQLFKRQLHKRDFLDHESLGLNLNHAKETASKPKSMTLINAPSPTNGLSDTDEDTKTLYERAFNDELWSLQWYEVRERLNFEFETKKFIFSTFSLSLSYKVGRPINVGKPNAFWKFLDWFQSIWIDQVNINIQFKSIIEKSIFWFFLRSVCKAAQGFIEKM